MSEPNRIYVLSPEYLTLSKNPSQATCTICETMHNSTIPHPDPDCNSSNSSFSNRNWTPPVRSFYGPPPPGTRTIPENYATPLLGVSLGWTVQVRCFRMGSFHGYESEKCRTNETGIGAKRRYGSPNATWRLLVERGCSEGVSGTLKSQRLILIFQCRKWRELPVRTRRLWLVASINVTVPDYSGARPRTCYILFFAKDSGLRRSPLSLTSPLLEGAAGGLSEASRSGGSRVPPVPG